MIEGPFAPWLAMSKHYSTNAGWEETVCMGIGSGADVAIDIEGNAVAIWIMSGDDPDDWSALIYRVTARYYAVGSGWGGKEVIASTSYGNPMEAGFDQCLVGMDLNGNAVAVYSGESHYGFVGVSHFTPETGWSSGKYLGAGSDYCSPTIDVSADGNAIVLHNTNGLSPGSRLIVDYYSVGSGWADSQVVGESWDYGCYAVANIEPSGRASILWSSLSVDLPEAVYYWPDSGLLTEAEVMGRIGGFHELDGDANGNAIAVGYRSFSCANGIEQQILANRFE